MAIAVGDRSLPLGAARQSGRRPRGNPGGTQPDHPRLASPALAPHPMIGMQYPADRTRVSRGKDRVAQIGPGALPDEPRNRRRHRSRRPTAAEP